MSEHPSSPNPTARPRALLVAVKLPEVDADGFTSGLHELERLVTTLGYDVVGTVTQARASLAPGAVLGEGKLLELAELTGGRGDFEVAVPRKKNKAQQRWAADAGEADDEADEADEASPDGASNAAIALIAVDHDLTPSQARNLERASGVTVLDRTGVIIDIFHRHAKSRQAKLQVELARLAYTAPRLRESPSGRERQQGRGAGEAALELDRRKIRDRMAELRQELAALSVEHQVRQKARHAARTVALVGYTNAGKSSLMRALTGSEVYVENKLFATLDTTVRALHPEVTPRVLVSDTVGFIKKLPHDLVASFKSTLDEAAEASLLLHVVDGSDPDWRSQCDVTLEVLREIEADDVPRTLVLNKADQLDEAARAQLRAAYPDALMISTRQPEDVAAVRAHVLKFFERDYAALEVLVPYDKQRLLAELHTLGVVDRTDYEDAGVRVQFRGPAQVVARLQRELG